MPLYSDLGLYYSSHLTATPSYYSSPFLGSGRSLGLLPPPRILPRVSPILPSIPETSSFSASRARTALDRSPASRYIPPPPSASRYKPLRIDTADIDVSSNRYNGLSSSHALGSEPERQNTIKRGRTVVRLHTKKFKENPALDAKRKMTPGEKLMQKFLILDKAEEEAKAARRKRLEEQEIRERAEAEVARLQAMAAAKSSTNAGEQEKTGHSESVESSSAAQNFPMIGGMTENAALDILLSAAEEDEPASGGEITRSGSSGTVKRRKTKDREGTVKLVKKKTKRKQSSGSIDEVQSPAEDKASRTSGDEFIERSTLQRRNTVRFRRNSQDTEAFPEVDSIPGSRRSSIDPGSRRSSFDLIPSDSRRSSLDSTTGDEISLPSENKSTVKKRKGPKNRIVVANVSIDSAPTPSAEPPSPKFVVEEVKVEQSVSPRPVGKMFRYEVIVEDVEGESPAPKHGKEQTKGKAGPVKKKKSLSERAALSKQVDKSSSGSGTDIESVAKGENKDSTLKSFQKSHDAKAEETVKQLAKNKTEKNKDKSEEKPKNNLENLKSEKTVTNDNELKARKISKQEITLKKNNDNHKSQTNGDKLLSSQKATQENKVSTPKIPSTVTPSLGDIKQIPQENIEKKKDLPVIPKDNLENLKSQKTVTDDKEFKTRKISKQDITLEKSNDKHKSQANADKPLSGKISTQENKVSTPKIPSTEKSSLAGIKQIPQENIEKKKDLPVIPKDNLENLKSQKTVTDDKEFITRKISKQDITLEKSNDKHKTQANADKPLSSKISTQENKVSTPKIPSTEKSSLAGIKQIPQENIEKKKDLPIIPKDNLENLKSQKTVTDDNEIKTRKISKQEITLEKPNDKHESRANGDKPLSGQKATQENKVSTSKIPSTEKPSPDDIKQIHQENIEKKKDLTVTNKPKLEKLKQVKRQADPTPVVPSPVPESKETDINFWAYINGSTNEEKILRKPVLPKEQLIGSDNKNILEEIKPKPSGTLTVQSDLLSKKSEEESEAIKGVTAVRVTKINKEAENKQPTKMIEVDQSKNMSPEDKTLEKQSLHSSAQNIKCETKLTPSTPQPSENFVDDSKTPFSENFKPPFDNDPNQTQASVSEIFCNKIESEETSRKVSSALAPSNVGKVPKNNFLKKQGNEEIKICNILEENVVPKSKQKLQPNKVVEGKETPLGKVKQGSGDTSNKVIANNDDNKSEKFCPAGDDSKFSFSSHDSVSEQIPEDIQRLRKEVKKLLYSEPEFKGSEKSESVENKKSLGNKSFEKDKTSPVTALDMSKLAYEINEDKKTDNKKVNLKGILEFDKKEEESSSELSKALNGNKGKLIDQKNKNEERSINSAVGMKGKLPEQKKKESDGKDKDESKSEIKSETQVDSPSNKKGAKIIRQKNKDEDDVEIPPTLKKEAKLPPQKNKNGDAELPRVNNSVAKKNLKSNAQQSEDDSSEISEPLTKTTPKVIPQKSKEDDTNTQSCTTQKKIAGKKGVTEKSKINLLQDEAPSQKTAGIKKLVTQKSKEDLPKEDSLSQKPPIEKKFVAPKNEDEQKKGKQAMQKKQSSPAVGKKLAPQKSKEGPTKDAKTPSSGKKLVTQKSKEDTTRDEPQLRKEPSSTAVKKQENQESKEELPKEQLPNSKKPLAQKSKDYPLHDASPTKKLSSAQVSTVVNAPETSKTPNRKSAGATKKAAAAVTAAAEARASGVGSESGSDADSEPSSGDEGESTTPRNSSTSSSGSSGGSSSGSGTASSDSGFDSRPSSVPDCDVNCHRKCEKLMPHLCGVNQKLIVEALAMLKRVSSTASEAGGGGREPGSPAPAYAFSPTLDPYSEDVGLLRGSGASASGRTTPPASSLPRFRKYTVDDFQFLKLLGKGTFGKVLLAELRGTDRYYAVKCLKKDVVLEDDDVECTLIERKVLALGTKHPYLCHLFCTFQTESHLLFVMEYLNGGDLMFHIQQSGRFPEPRARFYAAEIVCGLKFLHKKGIVYRDLKLDNILLDYQGHVRIADFGMCKLQIFLDRTADTFCGTPDYMAPEIVKGLKYNQCVDWWSFGVLVFEMLVGVSPFSGCDEDELFWSICNEQPQYPRFLSREAHSLLVSLLEKDALKRLGTPDSPNGDVPDHVFFRSVDWGALERRELDPPFTPRVKHPLDVQYFDTAFTAERPELTPVDASILQSMDQAQFQGFSYTNPNATD